MGAKAKSSNRISFDLQVKRAIELGIHHLYYKTQKAFQSWLAPLRQQAAGVSIEKVHLPALLVFPHTAMPCPTTLRQRRVLFRSLRFGGESVIIENESIDGYLNYFEDVPEIPSTPYLAVGVCNGAELSGPLDEQDAQVELDAEKSLPLTLDEGLWFALDYGSGSLFLGARLLGTRYTGNDGWADVCVCDGRLTIDDHDRECAAHVADFWVPYCKKRISVSLD